MASKNTDIIEQLADTICGNLVATSTKNGKETAPNDKTYPSIIIGVNQKFTDDVSEPDATSLVQKFRIPEKVDDGDNSYYTFKIDGVYYCKRQSGNFKLYDDVMVYIPNGNWSKMYLDYNTNSKNRNDNNGYVNLPDIIIAPDAPGGDTVESDLWFVVNDDSATDFTDITSDSFTSMYSYAPNDDEILSWQNVKPVISKTAPSGKVGDYWIKINNDDEFIRLSICTESTSISTTWAEIYPNSETETTPTILISLDKPMTDGDYWCDIDNENNKNLEAVYKYEINVDEQQYEWALKFNIKSGSGVGENVGKHNERFNDYRTSSNRIVDNSPDNQWVNDYNHAEGYRNTITDSSYCHVEGSQNSVGSTCSNCFVSGNNNSVTNRASSDIVSGYKNTVSGGAQSVVLGQNHEVTNCSQSVVGGTHNTVSSTNGSLVMGERNTVSGSPLSVLAGTDNDLQVSNGKVIGAGMINTCNGNADNSIFCGENNTITGNSSFTCGHHNVNNSGGILCGSYGTATYEMLAVGNGSSNNQRLIFFVVGTGDVYATGAFRSIGADYAEYFEWADGNPDNEDRCGMLVSLDGDRIVPAHGEDILGAVSAAPSVVGNDPQEWRGKYVRDVYGRAEPDSDGKGVLTDEYDRYMEYLPRSKRPEWAAVGLVGRLVVRDDGTCKVGNWIEADNGYAIPSSKKTNVKMLKRIDENHIEVIIK